MATVLTRRAAARLLGLGAAAAASGSALAEPAGITRLSAEDALARSEAGALLIVDVRTAPELARFGTPAGAAHADMRQADFLERVLAMVDGDRSRPVAFICARGARSNAVSEALTAAGFTAVHDVSEGMLGSAAGPGWLARELPLASQP